MGQRHVCTFRHAQRAAYRTAISAAQILVLHTVATVVRSAELQLRDGAKNATTSQARFSYAAEPVPCYARVKISPFLPIIAPRLRLLAIRHKQFYGLYGDSLASRSAPYIIWLLLWTIPPLC